MSERRSGAEFGRKVGLALFAVVFACFVVTVAVQLIREAFVMQGPLDLPRCEAHLQDLTDAMQRAVALPMHFASEEQAVHAFRAALSADEGRSWDADTQHLIDRCPSTQAKAAYALARLRGAHEAVVRRTVESRPSP